jgi:adenylate cyclase class IV
MEKNIEVEVRGLLSTEEYTKLKSFFDENAEKKEVKDRILIDYSTFLPGGVEGRKKDIRLRVTNGIPEIIVKLGEWGGSESRKELSVTTAPGTFDLLTEIFAALGYEKGVLAVRKSHVYDYKGTEFALVEVPGHSYYFEAEKMAHEGEDANELITEMNVICEELGITVFSKEEFFSYIQKLNKEANDVFNAPDAPPNFFKENYDLQ